MSSVWDQNILPGAEPFFLPGGKIGCLLIHGFTGSPKEMRLLGDFLSSCGYSVMAPRLDGHGTNIEDMAHTTWRDWMGAVEDGWHVLAGHAEQIFVAGLSMGGALALLLSSRLPAAGVIAMSTPFQLKADLRLRVLKLLRYFIPYAAKGEPDWYDASLEEDHVSYDRYPTASVLELKALLDEMRRCLPMVTSAALLMHSSNDQGVDPGNMNLIYDQLGSRDKSMKWVEKSGHVIIRDQEHAKVFSYIKEFIERLSTN